MSQNGIVGRTSQSTVILPDGYTQVDYIESSGTQYIDTGYKPSHNTSVEFESIVTQTGSSSGFCGARTAVSGSNDDKYVFIASYANNNDVSYQFNFGSTSSVLSLDVSYLQKNLYLVNKNKLYINNELKSFRSLVTFSTPYNLYLMAINTANTASLYAKCKLYYCKIYDDENLVRNFIPCYRNSDNEVGLYDLVNNVFYTNQGTDVFTYGSLVGIPNPDYPQSINNLSGDIRYKINGKNLFDKDNANIINGYIGGGAKISANSTDKIVYVSCKPNTTYSLQKMLQGTTNNNRFRIGTTTDIPVFDMYVEDYFNAGDGSTLTTKTITTGTNAKYLLFYCYKNDTLTSFEQMLNSIQIEKGSITTYEPYIEPQTFNIPLGDIELGKITTYKDKIYSSDGRFYLEKNISKVILNGGEKDWYYYTDTNKPVFYLNTGSNNDWWYNKDTIWSCYCNFYKGENITSTFDNIYNYGNYSISFRTQYPRLVIRDDRYNNLNSFKTWLSTHNIIVYYILSTPTTTEITQENYPLLYNALKQIQDYLTAYKINKEFILGHFSPEIEY